MACGNGDGAALNQLHHPLQILVGADRAVYVSDSYNHRAMKWTRDVQNGVVVAGGRGQGNSLAQLSYPCGIFVDPMGSVYVADQFNHRVMRWVKDAKEGEVIVSGPPTCKYLIGSARKSVCRRSKQSSNSVF